MRRAAMAMLAAGSLAGCNWVFGLEPTHAAPDAPDAPPPGVPIHLALLQQTLNASGSPQPAAEIPVPDIARVEAGVLTTDAIVTLTAGADGTVAIPSDVIAAPGWRFIYQRTGGVVHEYQNLPPEAHVIETVLGPVGAPAPASNTGYIITPAGAASHAINRVYTLGTWTEGSRLLAPPGATLDYDLPGATGLSGPAAQPSGTDHGVLLDYATDSTTNCLRSTGAGDFEAGMPGPPKPAVTASWNTVASTPTINTPLSLLSSADIAPLGETDRAAREQFGFLAASEVPLFTRPPDNLRSVLLPNPPMMLMRSCPLPLVSAAPQLVAPVYPVGKFKKAVHTETAAWRQLPGGLTVVNGIAIVTIDGSVTFDVNTSVAIAKGVKLTPMSGPETDLFGASDRVSFTRPAGPIVVSWDKTSATGVAGFWEIALIKVTGTTGVRKRIYVTAKQSFTLMPAELDVGGEYVLELTAFAGRPSAANGDFRGVDVAQSISVINARSFVVQ